MLPGSSSFSCRLLVVVVCFLALRGILGFWILVSTQYGRYMVEEAVPTKARRRIKIKPGLTRYRRSLLSIEMKLSGLSVGL